MKRIVLSLVCSFVLMVGFSSEALAFEGSRGLDLRQVCSLEKRGQELFRVVNIHNADKKVSVRTNKEIVRVTVKGNSNKLVAADIYQEHFIAKLKYDGEVVDRESIYFKRC